MIFALVAAAALVAGYLLGRVRPINRLDTWVWRQFTFGGPWLTTRPRQAVLLAVHALVRPAVTWDIWQHRSDRAPDRTPPQRDPDWVTNRSTDPGEEPPA